jgi:TPR repeat protein
LANTAQMFADYITTSSLDQIQKRAGKMNDAKAMLTLGDFHMFGLKNVPRDQKKAESFYAKAAGAGSAEACIQVAKLAYEKMLREHDLPVGGREKIPIPADTKSPELQVMWNHLERAVELDYVAPFLIDRLLGAQEYNSRRLSEKMEKILAHFLIDIAAQFQSLKASFAFACCASRCEIKFNAESALLKCGQCKSVSQNM